MNHPRVQDLQDAVAVLTEGHPDDADAFFESRLTHALGRQGGRLERAGGGHEAGVGLRRVENGLTAYGTTNDLTREGILRLAREVRGADPGDTVERRRGQPQASRVEVRVDPSQVPLVEKAALIEGVERTARAVDSRLSEIQVSGSDSHRHLIIVRADGETFVDVRIQVVLSLRCIATDGGQLQSGYGVLGGATGFELFDPEKVHQWTIEVAQRALRQLEAQPAPSGLMPVVLSSQAGGTMVHEAIGHGLEADLVQKGLSVYHGKVGQQVAAPWVTVLDDATIAGRRGFLHIDDEGSPGQRTVLVEKGTLEGFMHDRLTARRDGVASTGNGRRESYQHRPIVRMTNTLIAPGDHDPEAILEATPRGLFVTRMGGGQVDTTTGNFVFKVDEAFRIEGGRVGAPVRGATLIGNGPRILAQIDMVGSDLGFDLGTCGKDGQGVPVADAQPTLRIPEITIGGEQI
jgi:TldD protein